MHLKMWERVIPCRSELAREKPIGAAFIQETRVIVDVFREQARSYIDLMAWVQRCFMRSMTTANSRIEPRITYW